MIQRILPILHPGNEGILAIPHPGNEGILPSPKKEPRS